MCYVGPYVARRSGTRNSRENVILRQTSEVSRTIWMHEVGSRTARPPPGAIVPSTSHHMRYKSPSPFTPASPAVTCSAAATGAPVKS